MAQVDVAVIATNALFDAVIFVPPGIPFEARPDKPPMNNLYQEHHSFLVRGLHADLTMPTMCIERENTTIEGRMADIRRFLDMIGYQNMRDAA